MITKSDYLKYKDCSSFFWFWKNDQTVLSKEKVDPFNERLRQQGYEVELYARKLYPEARLISGNPVEAANTTSQLIRDGNQSFFQASFLVNGLFSSCDILVWNELFGGWDIIEVKSSSDKNLKKKVHLFDAAFQRIILQKAGLNVVNVYLLELNKEFYKNGIINPEHIFNTTEITTECINLEEDILVDIEDAKNLLLKPKPMECSCKYKGRSGHCRAFEFLYSKVPKYSSYDLRAIGSSKKVLRTLVDGGHLEIDKIPDDIKLSQTHSLQKYVTQTKEVVFEMEKIKNQFDNLKYPLYFLDYETLACGIPKFERTYPYQQTVFQYSLHIIYESGRIEHKDYIHRDQTTPVNIIAEKLREDIGDNGNVVVWNKSFESKCNEDLSVVNPELKNFLLNLNERIYDLMLVFKKMLYVHNDFKGRYSIKNVLPVMCPDLTYNGLDVSNGTEAVVQYESVIFGDVPSEIKKEKFEALLKYCKLDTWAMVRIFQELQKMIELNKANKL